MKKGVVPLGITDLRKKTKKSVIIWVAQYSEQAKRYEAERRGLLPYSN
jgi:hypothetical protein